MTTGLIRSYELLKANLILQPEPACNQRGGRWFLFKNGTRMRIGFIKYNFVSAGGGSERYSAALMDQLRSRGHEVHVFAGRWDDKTVGSVAAVHRVPVVHWPPFLRVLSFALNCLRAVEAIKPDLVFSNERTIQQDILRAGGGCHREWLIQRRRYGSWRRRLDWINPLHFTLLWLEKKAFSPANTRLVIANSERGKREITHHYGFPAERIHVIYNGTDTVRFRPSEPKPDRGEVVLLLVGSGFERKGVAFAIQALRLLPENVRLEVVGKGNRRVYEKLAKRLGVYRRVTFIRHTASVEAVYSHADILVHPAIYEPFSNACLEAMACGLPVVTTRINGASEIIVDGKNGAVVEDPSDSTAMARAIAGFLAPETRARAGLAARQTAEAMSMTQNVERTLAVIQDCVAAKRLSIMA